jgi:hypothetical protein
VSRKKSKAHRGAFHQYDSMYSRFCFTARKERLGQATTGNLPSPEVAYSQEIESRVSRGTPEEKADLNGIYSERDWWRSMRPYYKVWPSIVPSLQKTTIDMDGDQLRLPVGVVALRFKFGKEPSISDGRALLHSILAAVFQANNSVSRYVSIVVQGVFDSGLQEFENLVPLTGNLEASIQKQTMTNDFVSRCDKQYANSLSIAATKIAVSVFLLAKDPTIIEPEVLAADEAAYLASRDPKYVEKAKRRGVHGFHIGRQCEVMPHTRRPHFAIRWMGHGEQKVPRLRAIKGSVVHRKHMTQVPTGYITPDGVEVEPVETK